jgi:hypothetical protein
MDIEMLRKQALEVAATYALKVYALKALHQTWDENYFTHVIDRQEFWWKVAQLPPENHCWELIKRYFELIADPETPRNHTRVLYKVLKQRLS